MLNFGGSSVATVSTEDTAFMEALLAGVAEHLAAPSDELPSVRCVAKPTLIRELSAIRVRVAMPRWRRVSGVSLLQLLVRGGLARAVPLDDVRQGLPVDRLYAVGIGVDPGELDPVEILQAHVPHGVVCYFTALGVHGLTTQLPSHHHIAHLTTARVAAPPRDGAARAAQSNAEAPAPVEATVQRAGGADDGAAGAVHPLGTREFVYDGLPYYTTHREAHRVVGVQRRYLNDRTRFRVTTLEQTLLDTLHRPHSCGGPPVVYEAWETGAGCLNPERLAALLDRIGDARLTRRTGYMLDQNGVRPSPALEAVLARARSVPAPAHAVDADAIVPLLPGVPAVTIDARWGVAVP
jgi:uncharacterized ParB-like nuclease family protein